MVDFGRAMSTGEYRGRRYKRIVQVAFAQAGKTDTVLDVIGQRFDQVPVPFLYVAPTKQFLEEQIEPRIMALLDGASPLCEKVARGKRMRKSRKLIDGVPLRLAHGGSSAALKSDPAAVALVDEYDEMLANIKGMGDPLGLVEARGDTYEDFVAGITSTPSGGVAEVERDPVSGLEFWKPGDPKDIASPIWRKWQEGTRHHKAWPCPHCGEYFVPRFRDLRWAKNATPAEGLRTAYLQCPNTNCKVRRIEEKHKEAMNARAEYVAPGEKIDKRGRVTGAPIETSTLSFWASGLMSPFKTFGERAERFLRAVRSGDADEIQTAVNAAFGELYAPAGGEAPEWKAVYALRGGYRLGDIPDGVEVLTCTVDVQQRSLFYVIRGWGAQATSWLIDRDEIISVSGSTEEEEIWNDLAELISAQYGGLPIKMTLVDSGYRPGKPIRLPENRIYQFCARFKGRAYPTKGHDTQRQPVFVRRPEVNARGKVSLYGLDLIHLDTDFFKRWVFERIGWPQDRLGAWHLPVDVDQDYCMQMASERRLVTASGKVTWRQTSRANHYFDAETMAAAAGYILGVHRRQASGQPGGSRSALDIARAFKPPAEIMARDPYL